MSCLICGEPHGSDVSCSVYARTALQHTHVRPVDPSAPAVPWSQSSAQRPAPVPMPQEAPPPMAMPPDGGEGPDPLIGATVGSFRIVRELGRGGMGTVYLGEQTLIGSKVAIKFLHENLASNPGLVQRFYAEAKAVNVIGHANIISIFDMNVLPPNRYYLVMEYLEGHELSQVATEAMPAHVSIPILLQICDALDAAHKAGVVHRDLKPENVFLMRKGRQESFVKVLDFGIAKLFSDQVQGDKTAAGVIIGTPEYMAPEQANGEAIDGRCDLYSLGVIGYHLATGRLPFQGTGVAGLLIAHAKEIPTAPHLVNPEVPQALSAALMKALEKRPERRFQSAAEFGQALEAVLSQRQSPSAASSPSGWSALSIPLSADSGVGMFGGTGKSPKPFLASPAPIPPMPLASPGIPRSPPPRRPPTPMVMPMEAMPPPAPAHIPAPVPSTPRHKAGFEAALEESGGKKLGTLRCQDISRGGFFVCSESVMPALFTKLKVKIPADHGVDFFGEVVRHVPKDQAKAWGMSPGFGVQFVSLTIEQKGNLDLLVKGLPLSTTPAPTPRSATDDAVATGVLARYAQRINGDHYVLLGVRTDADFSDIRAKVRELKRELAGLLERPLSRPQRDQVENAQKRVQAAFDVIGYPGVRIEFDGHKGNFEGVAKCIAAGLSVTEIEAARKKHLVAHPGAETHGHIRFVMGTALENKKDFKEALLHYGQALQADPLNLKIQQKYWALRKKLGAP